MSRQNGKFFYFVWVYPLIFKEIIYKKATPKTELGDDDLYPFNFLKIKNPYIAVQVFYNKISRNYTSSAPSTNTVVLLFKTSAKPLKIV